MPNKKDTPRLLFTDARGKVFDYPGLEAAGMAGGRFSRLEPELLLPLPESSELFMLPDRHPVGYQGAETVVLKSDPYSRKSEPCFAVAAFIPPGYTLTHNTAYAETGGASMLPLFAYAACVLYKGKFHVAAVRVDRSIRHDNRFMDMDAIRLNIGRFQKLFPKNRLIGHLGGCATVNGCANAKNFFLERFEAPIPTSPVCNAQCQGCISFQPADRIPSTQKRIQFTPTPEEIAEIALFHIEAVTDPIVSFGQGCEGEPSLAADAIEKAIRLIRARTSKGVLNMNTNASRPQALARLFDAGLNTVRVSTNSVREPYYSRYYQPKGYSFKELCESVETAKKAGAFVSINYLSMPGFTDSEDEVHALEEFIARHDIHMVQWRNLNYDPLHYFRDLKLAGTELRPIGMKQAIERIRRKFPRLLNGYFNPRPKKVAQLLGSVSR